MQAGWLFYETAQANAKATKGEFTEDEILEYIRVCTPENIHGVCEDYRAAASIDLPMDTADLKAGRKLQPEALVLWGAKSVVVNGNGSHSVAKVV